MKRRRQLTALKEPKQMDDVRKSLDTTPVNRGMPFYRGRAFWSLTITNAVIIIWALVQGWSVVFLMWAYWCQSLIIGLFWFFKILGLKDYVMPGIDDLSMEKAFEARNGAAFFFIMSYGFVHGVIAFFLYGITEAGAVSRGALAIASAFFFVSECVSFPKSSAWVSKKRPTAAMIVYPFIRTVPMFVPVIIAMKGSASGVLLVVFLVLKSIADTMLHSVQYRNFGHWLQGERYMPLKEVEGGRSYKECAFCAGAIPWYTEPRVLKNKMVCEKCYKMIKEAKEDSE